MQSRWGNIPVSQQSHLKMASPQEPAQVVQGLLNLKQQYMYMVNWEPLHWRLEVTNIFFGEGQRGNQKTLSLRSQDETTWDFFF
ncbi:hypothetical protein TNCV_3872991 [Trichonephila clavipes]|nr:hypothetical protein TNCV_3872991 [Trichonephila clavipes]